jgi:hypothetical protein
VKRRTEIRRAAGSSHGADAPGKASVGGSGLHPPGPPSPALISVTCQTCNATAVVPAERRYAWKLSHQSQNHFGHPWSYSERGQLR